MSKIVTFVIIALSIISPQILNAQQIDLGTLLENMLDRTKIAEFPEPEFLCKQTSSYNRRSKTPGTSDWFANDDSSYFYGSQQIDGRTEWIMLDVDGPGVIVRWWITQYKFDGTVRVYLDNDPTPVLQATGDKLIGPDGIAGAPLNAVRAWGRNLYFPIPFAKHCKITYDGPNKEKTGIFADCLYYNINYTQYPESTKVKTFTMDDLKTNSALIDKVQTQILLPKNNQLPTSRTIKGGKTTLNPGKSITRKIGGNGAISALRLKLTAPDIAQAMRSTVITASFDGKQTVWAPLGEFFGTGAGLNPFKGWWRQVETDGWMNCWWPMPFKQYAAVTITNHGTTDVIVELADIAIANWTWTDRTMYFHSTWRGDNNILIFGADETKMRDWNYVTVQGKGVYAGDTMSVYNRPKLGPIGPWWGEGDEKIFVDGEPFPSHFGTGTEDYYGYAWGTAAFFDAPFHAQPIGTANKGIGHTTNTRTRSLDTIPFNSKLQLDMELAHWQIAKVDYSSTSYFYAFAPAKSNGMAQPDKVRQPVGQLLPVSESKHLSPPLGWNSYTGYSTRAPEKEILKNIDYISKNLLPYGYNYVAVDAGWFLDNIQEQGGKVVVDKFGRPEASQYFFPSGLKYVADYAHERGVKLGIWLIRGVDRKAVEDNLPIEGTSYHLQDIADKKNLCPWNNFNYGVDMTKSGSQEYYDSLIKKYADLGIDFIKFDDIVPNPPEIDAVVKAIENCGRDILLSLSPGDYIKVEDSAAYKGANMVRITSDIWDHRGALDNSFKRWEEMQDYDGADVDSWIDLDMVCFGKLYVTRDGGWDCKFTNDQKRTFMVQRSMAASPIILGGVMHSMDSFSLNLFTNLDILACNQNGVIGKLVHRNDKLDVWKTPEHNKVNNGWLGIFNRDKEIALTANLDAKQLGLDPTAKYTLTNLWTQENFPTAETQKFEIPTDGVIFIKYEQIK